jgi:hypothetical protein
VDQAWAALGGALLGSSAGIGSGLMLENYKRHRDRCGVASSLAGEIASILGMAEMRRHVEYFMALAERAERGEGIVVEPVVLHPHELPPVIAKNLDRLGLLPGDLPSRVITFYTYVMGVRGDIGRLAAGEYAQRPGNAAVVIRQDLALWEETRATGRALVSDLTVISSASWRPWK